MPSLRMHAMFYCLIVVMTYSFLIILLITGNLKVVGRYSTEVAFELLIRPVRVRISDGMHSH